MSKLGLKSLCGVLPYGNGRIMLIYSILLSTELGIIPYYCILPVLTNEQINSSHNLIKSSDITIKFQ